MRSSGSGLVSTIVELLEGKSSDSGLETEITAVGNLCGDHAMHLSAKVGTN
jgi:hypothetical protein